MYMSQKMNNMNINQELTAIDFLEQMNVRHMDAPASVLSGWFPPPPADKYNDIVTLLHCS